MAGSVDGGKSYGGFSWEYANRIREKISRRGIVAWIEPDGSDPAEVERASGRAMTKLVT